MKYTKHYTRRANLQLYYILGVMFMAGFVAMLVWAPGERVTRVATVEAAEVVPTPTTKPLKTDMDFLEMAARIYGVNPYLMYCLTLHESNFVATAKNPHSTAYGYGQFINSTWKSWRTKMGEDANLELRSNPQEAFWTMSWALNKGYRHHWEANRLHCAGIPLRPQ